MELSSEKVFGRFFGALKEFLVPERDEELLQLGLIVLWEMMEHLPLLMEDRESDIFAILFTVRYSDKQSVSPFLRHREKGLKQHI